MCAFDSYQPADAAALQIGWASDCGTNKQTLRSMRLETPAPQTPAGTRTDTSTGLRTDTRAVTNV